MIAYNRGMLPSGAVMARGCRPHLWLLACLAVGCAEGAEPPPGPPFGYEPTRDGSIGDGSIADGSMSDDGGLLGDGGAGNPSDAGGMGWPTDGAVDMGSEPTDERLVEGSIVSAGFYHTCSAQPDGRAQCWGYQVYGRLGDGTNDTRHVPGPVLDLTGVIQVDNQGYDDIAFSCAATSSGKVWCWGNGAAGKLGNDSVTATNRTPVEVVGLSDATQVTVGDGHACALRQGGSIVCWGQGANGKLGNGAMTNSHVPVAVMNVTDAVQVSAGGRHTCAVRATGQVVCWGDRGNGRLGDGGSVAGNEVTPVTVSGIDDAVQVSSGSAHTCAVRASGQVMCWGDRGNGRIGNGGSVAGDELSPVAVTGIDDAVQVSAGFAHTCVSRASGGVACWGDRGHGRLGDGGSTAGDELTPVSVPGLDDIVQVSAGYWTSCAADSTSAVFCWGYNVFGMLGDDSTTQRPSPVSAVGLPR